MVVFAVVADALLPLVLLLLEPLLLVEHAVRPKAEAATRAIARAAVPEVVKLVLPRVEQGWGGFAGDQCGRSRRPRRFVPCIRSGQ